MFVRTLSAALLIGLACQPALAEDASSLDLVAATFIGFSSGGKATVADNQVVDIVQSGPGQFSGGEGDIAFSFTVTEPETCNFLGTFTVEGKIFSLGINMASIESMRFDDPQPIEGGLTRYKVVLEGPDNMVETIDPDGGHHDGGKSSPMGTSLTLDELNAAAATLMERCADA